MLRQVTFDLPPDEVVAPGHQGCAGCGAALAMRLALKALGRKTVLVVAHGCWSVIDGPWPYSAAGVPLIHVPSSAAAAVASGVRAALAMDGDQDTNVCVLVNNGRPAELLSALSSAAARGERVLFVCYDTGSSLAVHERTFTTAPSASPVTATANAGPQPGTDLLTSIAAIGLPYAATATVAFPDDFAAKLAKARRFQGPTFLHVLAPCPPAWEIPSAHAIRAARMAVLARAFPLVENEDGRAWRVTLDPGRLLPLEDYLRAQGRFRVLLDQPEALEATRVAIEQRWHSLH